MKKFLHITSIFLCTFFLCFCVSPQSAKATTTIGIDLQYGQSEARDMLQMVNSFRTNPSEAWAWNQSNSERDNYSNLSYLQYDYELERIAMLRAAEIAISFSHTRPNGTDCFTAYGSSNTYSYKGENIASGYPTASAAFEGWKETNEQYSGQGHRRNMLGESFNAIGIGHVSYNGRHYWVQEFGYAVFPNTAPTAANNNRQTVNIETLSSYTPGSSGNGSGYREYTITFYSDYSNSNENTRQTTVNQRLTSFPNVWKNGYTFKGWYTQPSGGNLVTSSTVFYNDTPLYAQWESTYSSTFTNFTATEVTDTTATVTATIPFRYVRTYGITLGTSSSYMPDTRVMNSYATTSVLTIPLTGLTPDTTYYFKLYYTTDSDRIESLTGSFTTKKASEFTVTFYGNGGTVDGLSSYITVNQRLSSLPNARRENYRFDGWYTAASGGTQVTSTTVFNTNSSVYAHWTYLTQNPSVPGTNPGSSGTTGGGTANPGGSTGNNDYSNIDISEPDPDESNEPVSVEKVKLKSLKNTGKGKLKAAWAWDAYGDGYQISYSTSSKFPASKTKLKNAGVFTDSKTITGLKKGTTYYVRVRTFQKVDGVKHYGPWSNVKKLKLKK